MKVAVISDIHGNALALEAVLTDVDAEGVDAILNLGDHVAGPLEPRRTMELLGARPMLAIRGNTDRYLLEETDKLEDDDRAVLAELTPADRDWLKALPATAVFEDAIFLSHGAPSSDEIYWLDKPEGSRFRPASRAEVVAELPERRLSLYCCGHTHVARVVRLDDGGIVFNPGSVGRPSFTMSDRSSVVRASPDAAYALVTQVEGDWSITLRQVPYDHHEAARIARDVWDSPGWARDLTVGRRR